MKFFKLLVFCSFFITISCKNQAPEKTGIIPQPNFIEYEKGTFTITEKTVIVVDESEKAQRIVEELVSFFDENFDVKLNTSPKIQDNSIQLKIV